MCYLKHVMNTITANPPTSEFNCGDIFTLNNNEFYIMCATNSFGMTRYACINLSSGSSRNGFCESKEAAIDDLTFSGRNMKITIQP